MSFDKPTENEKKKIYSNKLISPSSSTVQQDGSQKTQLVDSEGNIISATSNALDVNIKTPVTLSVNLDNADDDVLVYGWSGAVNVKIKTDAGGELQIDVLNFPATQAVTQSGTWNITNVSGTISLPAGASTEATLSSVKTAVEVIDNFISGARGLVTEDNSASIKTAVETIDNFISGSRGLVTEDNSAAIKTAVETIDNAIAGSEMQVDVVTIPTVVTNAATAEGKTLTFVPIAQGAAGTTVLVVADATKKHKLMGFVGTITLAGTMKFTDGAGDLSGAFDLANNGGMVLPTSIIPYLQTSTTNTALNLVSTVSTIKGFAVILTEA